MTRGKMDDKHREQICKRTISHNAFFALVKISLKRQRSLSCVRLADGEVALLKHTTKKLNQPGYRIGQELQGFASFNESWLSRYGLTGISYEELQSRLLTATQLTTYLAPSVTGLWNPLYNAYGLSQRDCYVDNFFPDLFTNEQKTELYQLAGHVLLIHNNPRTADSMQLRLQGQLGVKVSFIRLENWRDASVVIAKAVCNTAPLVLWSGGPGNKHLGEAITSRSTFGRVLLDVGHAADRWTMSHLAIDREKAEAFHAMWQQENSVYKEQGENC
jgi:hypothetical protein